MFLIISHLQVWLEQQLQGHITVKENIALALRFDSLSFDHRFCWLSSFTLFLTLTISLTSRLCRFTSENCALCRKYKKFGGCV